ncbi:hypothetical protein Tco_0813414 [Tanacetum coccineum]
MSSSLSVMVRSYSFQPPRKLLRVLISFPVILCRVYSNGSKLFVPSRHPVAGVSHIISSHPLQSIQTVSLAVTPPSAFQDHGYAFDQDTESTRTTNCSLVPRQLQVLLIVV